MILNRQYFEVANRCVLEKILVKTPMRYQGIFPNEACFLYVKSGNILVSAPAEQLMIAATGSVLLNCGNYFADLVQQSADATMEVIAVHLYPDMLRDLYPHEWPVLSNKASLQQHLDLVQEPQVLSGFFNGLALYFDNPSLASPELILLKIKELVLLLLRTNNAPSLSGLFGRLFTPREVTLQEVVKAHLYSNLSLQELAMLSGQSLSSFKRAFQKLYGESPANYIREQKLEAAKRLLRVSTYTISEICFRVGFNEGSHFTKSFRQQYGMAPAEYRKTLAVGQHEPD